VNTEDEALSCLGYEALSCLGVYLLIEITEIAIAGAATALCEVRRCGADCARRIRRHRAHKEVAVKVG
jgi:hypothetical protein